MSWASKATVYNGSTTPTTTYADYGSQITLNPGETCVMQIAATHAATAAADILFQILAADDNGGTVYDSIPYMSGSLGKGANSATIRRTVVIFGIPAFKVQLSESTSETFTNVTITIKKDGISA